MMRHGMKGGTGPEFVDRNGVCPSSQSILATGGQNEYGCPWAICSVALVAPGFGHRGRERVLRLRATSRKKYKLRAFRSAKSQYRSPLHPSHQRNPIYHLHPSNQDTMPLSLSWDDDLKNPYKKSKSTKAEIESRVASYAANNNLGAASAEIRSTIHSGGTDSAEGQHVTVAFFNSSGKYIGTHHVPM
ncbi:unnamed protein product [Peniophora sp. CBMAI 1063]|nr:unnamed protein product [Peniophora sp. CBMAI 1063]